MTPEILDAIDNKIYQSHNATVQSLTALIGSIQNQFKEHREEEQESREAYRKTLTGEVLVTMKGEFNGKMDRLSKEMKEQSEKLDKLIARSTPVIEKYEGNENGKRWALGNLSVGAKIVGSVGIIIAGSIATIKFLLK